MYNSPLATLKSINAKFAKGLAVTPISQMQDAYETVDSNGNTEKYIIFDNFGYIKEWLDEISFEGLKDYELEIRNKDWQFGIMVSRNTIEDAKDTNTVDIDRQVRTAVQQWTGFPDELINDLLTAGASTPAFDKSNLFATSRPNLQGKGGTINNIVTGTGTTLAQITADLTSARAAMKGFKDRNNKPFNKESAFTVICPPQLEDVFLRLQTADLITLSGSTQSNIFKGTFNFVTNVYQDITNNDWFLFNNKAAFKPFIYQKRRAPIFEMNDDHKRKFVEYFSTARMAAGPGNPTAIVKIDN